MDDKYSDINQQDDYNSLNNYQGGQELEPVMSIGQWIITALVMSIPCVNIVMLFVWGFGSGNQNRANYCKASLILWIIGLILSVLLMQVMGSAVAGITSAM